MEGGGGGGRDNYRGDDGRGDDGRREEKIMRKVIRDLFASAMGVPAPAVLYLGVVWLPIEVALARRWLDPSCHAIVVLCTDITFSKLGSSCLCLEKRHGVFLPSGCGTAQWLLN